MTTVDRARENRIIGNPLVRVRDVKKNYELPSGGALFGGGGKQIKAVQDLSFEARQKQIVAIVGESGCGKSTFAKVLMGLENGNGGSIVMGDEKPRRTAGRKTQRRTYRCGADGFPKPE